MVVDFSHFIGGTLQSLFVCACVDVPVTLELCLLIQQTRLNSRLSQKDLAAVSGQGPVVCVCVSFLFCMQKINEKVGVVNDYESGKAVPNHQVIAKLERALGELCSG